jgi:alpha-tubulin N-acetyltransferase 1
VTTSRKFRISDHRLYIVKNSTDNKYENTLFKNKYIIFCFSSNLGSVIGFLKVGVKHLYVYDSHGQVHERTPLCVLDFYVHESKQRSGYGKKLFDVMLEVNL